MTKLNKILLVSNTDGALYKFRSSLIEKLKEEGFEVICIASPESPEGSYFNRLHKICDKYFTINFIRQSKFSLLRSSLKINKIIKYEKPQLIHVFGHEAFFFTFLSTLFKHDYKLIITITGLGRYFDKSFTFTSLIFRFFIIQLYRFNFNRIDKIIFLNSHDINLFSELFPKFESKFIQINGEGSRFEIEKNIPEQFAVRKFLFASRLMIEKGVIELIQAFQKLPMEYSLTILGSIDDDLINHELIDLLQKGDIKNVKYFGFVQDITPFLDKCFCVILPSKYMEGLPIILVEALSKGKLIITSNSPGCSDTIIPNVNGLILNDVKPKYIQDAIKQVEKMDLTKAHKESISLFEQRFSCEVVNRSIFSIYKSLFNA